MNPPQPDHSAERRTSERSAQHSSERSSQQRADKVSQALKKLEKVSVSRTEEELEILIRARYPILFVTTWEEERVEQILQRIADRRGKQLFLWTITRGILRAGVDDSRGKSGGKTTDPISALDAVIEQVDPSLFLFKDFHPFVCKDRSNISIIRRLRDVAQHLRNSYKTIIISAPAMQLAPELQKDVTVLDFDLPDVEEFSQLLDRITRDVQDNSNVTIDLAEAEREKLLSAARGLTLKEAENVFAKTIVTDGSLTASDINIVFSEKKQIIKKSGILEYYESSENFKSVGGLDNLKTWFRKRSVAFSKSAAKFGLPAPRGVLLLGVQGCGKSLCAKAVSALWNLPLLRFDIGRIFSSLVGSSEENVRQAISTAESVAPVILWIDEIDKAFASSSSSAGSDGGTSLRVFGTLLTWLAEKTSAVFVVATANNISHLPPELFRKGRLDEIFFVDLPGETERKDILKIHLQKRGRKPDNFDLDLLTQLSAGFSGAELEEAIISSLFDAFSEKSDITTEILRASLEQTVPLSQTMNEELTKLRNWANGRARPASGKEERTRKDSRRKIELE